MGKVVLVTGVSRRLAGRFVQRVQCGPDVDRVIAVDAVPPACRLGDAEFLRVDRQGADYADVLAEHGVDTVVHLAVDGGATVPHRGRAAVKEDNVIGTMRLLGACQRTPTLRRLVVRSSTLVYGGAPTDPAVCTESTAPREFPGDGFARDMAEIEGYVRGFARRRPEVAVCVLRFAHILGRHTDSPLGAYFRLPVLPTVLGHDPRLQFVHEDDAVAALCLAAGEPRPGTRNVGTFNVAGDGVVVLSQAARRLGRPTVPLLRPALGWLGTVLHSIGVTDLSPEQVSLLTYGRVVHTGRMREVLGFTPAYTTSETFADFVRGQPPGLLPPESLARAVDRIEEAVHGG